MKKLFSLFLLATVLTTGFCPSIMVATEVDSSCHEMERMNAEKESFNCDHIDFFDDTVTQQYFDFFIDGDISVALVIEFQDTKKYSVPSKIIPQVAPIPPPKEWEKQKQTIVLRV